MNDTKPLKELIAELQALENANPGIHCLVEDNEWGPNIPTVKLAAVYKENPEYEQLTVVDEVTKQHTQKTVTDYTEKSAEQYWSEMDHSDADQYYESFEQFKEEYEMVLKCNSETFEKMNNSVPMVIISIL